MQFYGHVPQYDLTYSDVFLVPSRSDVGSRMNVDLQTPDQTGMRIPLVASNMNAVTGKRMAAAMARRGGLAVLPQDLGARDVRAELAWVKAQDALVTTPFTFAPETTIARVLRCVPAVEGQGVALLRDGQVELVIQASDLAKIPKDAQLRNLRHLAAPQLPMPATAREAFDQLEQIPGKFAAICRDGQIIGSLSQRDALRSSIYPAAVDAQGRLRAAAAIGVNGDVVGRAQALVEHGVNVLVVDTAHGHQAGMLRALEQLRKRDLGVPLVAGNVVSAAGARDLVSAGANIVKVGVGPGAMCTTRMMTAVGRPQFSAVLETAQAAAQYGATVWADGGVRYPRDIALALAAGAGAVMIGSWFAGTVEAPGSVLRDAEGRLYKESFGMASSRAVAGRFAALEPYERARKLLFSEGISHSTLLINPERPSVDDLLDMITTGIRSSFTYTGASSIQEFHERAKVGLQSAAGYEEGKPVPVSW